jgi:predicted transcriptional regulator
MKPGTSGDTLVPVPSDLHAAIEEAAAEEHRAPSDLVGEAIKRYLAERHWFRKDDVHAKIAAGLESLRRGEGLDDETVMAEMLAALDASEDER